MKKMTMDKKLLEKVKKQLLDEKPRKLGWTLPKWVAQELFDHIDELEKDIGELRLHISEVEKELYE